MSSSDFVQDFIISSRRNKDRFFCIKFVSSTVKPLVYADTLLINKEESTVNAVGTLVCSDFCLVNRCFKYTYNIYIINTLIIR